MTVKEGDLVFISNPNHPGQEVAGIVMPGTPGQKADIHIISSADPYSIVKDVPERRYVDHHGFRKAGEWPIDYSPEAKAKFANPDDNGVIHTFQETSNADAPQEHSDGEPEASGTGGDGSGVVHSESDSSETEDETGEDQPDQESTESEGPSDVEDSDEREEDESSEEVPQSAQDGEPVSATKRKRGGKSRR